MNEIDFNYEINLLNNFRNFPDFYLLVKIDIKEKNVLHVTKHRNLRQYQQFIKQEKNPSKSPKVRE